MLTLFGATGYTGRFAALYLRDHAPDGLEWAIAARNPEKLAAVHRELGDAGRNVRQVVADADDPASMDRLAAETDVVVNTAGPFALLGTPVVDACVRHGTDYCDITGETPWVRDIIDTYHETAVDQGTRIVPFCGMDSVPSDIGAFYVVRQIREQFDLPTASVRAVFKLKGGISGGTLASMMNIAASGALRRLADPVLLNPPGRRTASEREASPDVRTAEFDEVLGEWTTPFLMGAVNSRVVRRSAALMADAGDPYGPAFRYRESMWARSHAQAVGVAAGLGAFFELSKSGLGRKVVAKLGPKPGEGPDEQALERGFLHCRYVGVAADGRTLVADMKAKGDPGYRVTIMMLCEAGLQLAATRERNGKRPPGSGGGVLTPATALGMPYIDRMRAAGLTLEVR